MLAASDSSQAYGHAYELIDYVLNEVGPFLKGDAVGLEKQGWMLPSAMWPPGRL